MVQSRYRRTGCHSQGYSTHQDTLCYGHSSATRKTGRDGGRNAIGRAAKQSQDESKRTHVCFEIFIVYYDPYDKDSTNGTGSTQYLQEQLFETLWVASELGGGAATLT